MHLFKYCLSIICHIACLTNSYSKIDYKLLKVFIIRYLTREEFNQLVTFVTQEKHFSMVAGFEENEEELEISVWVAADDNDIEGRFVNWYSNQPLSYLPWPPNRPYKGGTSHNYLQALITVFRNTTDKITREAVVIDEREIDEVIPICTVNSKVLKLKLRGLCKDFSLNRDYYYTITEVGEQLYQGRTTSAIRYDHTSKLWIVSDRNYNSSIITSASPWESFLLGLHQLDFSKAKDEKCFRDKEIQPMKLTSCKEGMFTCNNGVCIDIDHRCDQTVHCEDTSDEKNCKLVIMEENYNKNIAPFTVNPLTNTVEEVHINVSANVIDIVKINEVEQTFKLKFQLILNWYDFRLIFHNLKESRIANSPSIDAVERFWIPNIIFSNTEANDVIAIDPLARVTISREGAFVSSDETVLDEINIFKGSENKITFDKVYTKTLKCIYELQLYPFDTQECTVDLSVSEYEVNVIKIIPRVIKMKSKTLLSQYFITGWTLDYTDSGKNRFKIFRFKKSSLLSIIVKGNSQF